MSEVPNSDFTVGWDRVQPGCERYYALTPGEALVMAKETCAEWDYASDPHNYCHQRSWIVALIREVERLAGAS